MNISFFKTPKNKKFNYTPIYYNEAKEEQKERERRIREEMGIATDEDKNNTNFEYRIRGMMHRGIKSNFEVTRKARRTSNLRVILILIALLALFYYLYMSN